MSQQNQSSSNDTSFSFANAAPAQAINDTPGSGAAVLSRTEDLKVERLHIASWWSAKLVPYGEAPTGRRRQDLHALRGPVPWIVVTPVAEARRARPRGRVRWAGLLPHPNASHLAVLRGTRARRDFDVNFNTTSTIWKRVSTLGLNWKID